MFRGLPSPDLRARAPRRSSRSTAIASVAFVLFCALMSPRAADAVTYLTDTLSGTTDTNFTYGGDACLTAGTGAAGGSSLPACPAGDPGGVSGTMPDPPGEGALRLTNNQGSQAGFVVFSNAIPSANGLQAIFTEYAYDGTGADGISFFFLDASQPVPTSSGAYGGSLGYAQETGIPGIAAGYLGIGMDEYGNYSNPTQSRVGGPGEVPETIAIRGNVASSYAYVTGYHNTAGAASSLPFTLDTRAATVRGNVALRTIRITLTGTLYLSVDINTGSGYVNYIPPTYVGTINGSSFPATLRFGFAASTGGSTNIHEINDLTVTDASAVQAVVTGPVGLPSAIGSYDGVSAVNNNDDFTERSFTPSGVTPTVGSTYPTAVTGIAVPNALVNAGFSADTYAISVTAPSGWTVQLCPDNGVGTAGSGTGGNGASCGSLLGTAVPTSSASSSANNLVVNAGTTVVYWAVFAAPAGVATFTRFDAPVTVTSDTTAAITNMTHDELYSGFVTLTKAATVAATNCPAGQTVPASGICPGGKVQYVVTYTNVAQSGGTSNNEPAAALLSTKAGTLQIVEDGSGANAATPANDWGTDTTGLQSAPVDSNTSSTFLYGAAPGSATFTAGTTRFVDTIGGAAGVLAPAAKGTLSFSLIVR